MRFQFQSPALLLAAIIILAFGATTATILAAAGQPAADAAIVSRASALPLIREAGSERLILGLASPRVADRTEIRDRATLEARLAEPGLGIAFQDQDFVEDPDMLPSYETSDDFYARQGIISQLLDGGEVLLARSADSGFSGGVDLVSVPVKPARGIGSLPLSFWIQIAMGLVVILVAAVFLALRPRSFAVLSFAFAGLGISGAAYTAALYSSRQLGMDPGLMAMLSGLNHVFTVSFGVGMIALFSVYPVRIANPMRTALPAAILSYGSLAVARLRLLPHDVVMLQNVVALLLVAILVLVFLQ